MLLNGRDICPKKTVSEEILLIYVTYPSFNTKLVLTHLLSSTRSIIFNNLCKQNVSIRLCAKYAFFNSTPRMHGSTFFKSLPTFAEIHCSCDKVDHKQEIRFLLYILGLVVT